jgi:hypothetical protein
MIMTMLSLYCTTSLLVHAQATTPTTSTPVTIQLADGSERLPRLSVDYGGPLAMASILLNQMKKKTWNDIPNLFANDAIIRYDNKPLPFAGEYHGTNGVVDFFDKVNTHLCFDRALFISSSPFTIHCPLLLVCANRCIEIHDMGATIF